MQVPSPKLSLVQSVQPYTIPATEGVAIGTETDSQYSPSGQVEHAVKTLPLVPTGNATGVFAADPTITSPLAVMQAFGM